MLLTPLVLLKPLGLPLLNLRAAIRLLFFALGTVPTSPIRRFFASLQEELWFHFFVEISLCFLAGDAAPPPSVFSRFEFDLFYLWLKFSVKSLTPVRCWTVERRSVISFECQYDLNEVRGLCFVSGFLLNLSHLFVVSGDSPAESRMRGDLHVRFGGRGYPDPTIIMHLQNSKERGNDYL